MTLFLAALILPQIILDGSPGSRFMLSRPLVIGAALGQMMGQGSLGIWVGLFFEAIDLQRDADNPDSSSSAAFATAAAMLLHAPPHELPWMLVIPTGLIIGFLHKLALSPIRQGGKETRMPSPWAINTVLFLILLYVVKPIVPKYWPYLPALIRESLVFASNYSFYIPVAVLIRLLVAPDPIRRPLPAAPRSAFSPIEDGMTLALEEDIAQAPAEEKLAQAEKLAALKDEVSAVIKETVGSLWTDWGSFCAVSFMALNGTIYLLNPGASVYAAYGVLLYLLLLNAPLQVLRRSGFAWGYEWNETTPAMIKALPWQDYSRWLRRAGTVLALYWTVPMLNPNRQRGFMPMFALTGFLAASSLRLSPALVYAGLCVLGAVAWLAGWKLY